MGQNTCFVEKVDCVRQTQVINYGYECFREGRNLLHPRKCSESVVGAFAERYNVVWTKKVIRRNGRQPIVSKNEEHRLK